MALELTPTRLRVLVIDDEPALARALCRLLTTEYEASYTTRPTDALQRLREGERFDAIVCDVQMPGMSGIELYERLTAEQPSQAERMMFLTGLDKTSWGSVQAPWLPKPTPPSALRAMLRDLLREVA